MPPVPLHGHQLADERSRALHAAVAERLLVDERILERARRRVRAWLAGDRSRDEYAIAWASILAGDAASVAQVMTDRGERARDLRQASPFAGALDPRTRWSVLRDPSLRPRRR